MRCHDGFCGALDCTRCHPEYYVKEDDEDDVDDYDYHEGDLDECQS